MCVVLLSTKMNDEQLIECVGQYPVLYDLSHSKYMDINFKNDIWNNIGEQMKTDGPTCKARWNNIRDTYRKSLKKSVTRSGRSAKKIKLYKYSDQLNFLKKYFDDRETRSNIESQEVQQDGETQREDEENIQVDPEESVSEEDLQSQPSLSTVQMKKKPTFQVSAKSIRQKQSAKNSVPQQTAVAKLLGYLINKNESQASTLAPHPVDAFLGGIAPTLKTFSPYDLHLAKSEIFAIVQRYELKTIMEQHSYRKPDLNNPSHPGYSSTTSSSVSTPLPSPCETFLEHTALDQHQNSSSPIDHTLQNYFQNFQDMTTSPSNLLPTAFSDFAIKLYKSVSEQKDNVVVSPLSISTALSMVLAGAKGNTAEQIAKVLSIDNIENTFAEFPDLMSHLNSRNVSEKIKIANRVFLEKELPITNEFTHLMKEVFQTEYGKVSFSSQSSAAKEAINSWVSEITNEKIKQLLTDDIDPMTRLLLVSAIYFKGFWAEKFSKDSTEVLPFYLNSKQSVKTEIMYQKKKFGYAYDNELKAKILDLPYVKNTFSFIVILPDDVEGLSTIEHQLDSKKLNTLLLEVRKNRRKLHVHLPKFKLEQSLGLKPLLSAMGVVDMFCMNKADLSGIVKDNNLYVKAVIHKAYIDVNEEGTEAAAATAVRISKRSLEIIPEFRADHPFIFLLVENSRNLILFIGALKVPKAAESTDHEEL